jgi:hypothetical protein
VGAAFTPGILSKQRVLKGWEAMGEMNYERYCLEADHSTVMNQVRRYVFFRTDFEEKKMDACLPDFRKRAWPDWPKSFRQVLWFPIAVMTAIALQIFAHIFWGFFVPQVRRFKVKSYAGGLKKAVREWKKAEKWLHRPEVRATILKADVPDGEGEDPFFVAEKISRFLLTDREIREDFKFESYTNRIAMSALVLADIGFADYREFEDPQKRRKRSRREY